MSEEFLKEVQETLSMFKAIGIVKEYRICRRGVDEEGREYFIGEIRLPSVIGGMIENIVDDWFNHALSNPEYYQEDLERIAKCIKNEFEVFREKTGGDLLDLIVCAIMLDAVVCTVAIVQNVNIRKIWGEESISKLASALWSGYKNNEELREQYEYWRAKAEELRLVLKSMKLL